MCIVVIAGGPNKDLTSLLPRLKTAESLICADSGADALRPFGILPDEVWGDMDSISEDTRNWISENHIHTRLFPVEKDMTDSEICLRSVPKEKEVLFVTSLLGRTDHVMANLFLTMKLREEGRRITATDGVTWVFPLRGRCRFDIPGHLVREDYTCSLIPMGRGAEGVSTIGMKYPLSEKTILPGSSLTVSNEFRMEEKEHGFTMSGGTVLVIVTPRS